MSGPQELAPGALVTPSIRLVRELGRGGMGSVWIAEHLRLHTQVVVKFMAAEYALNQEAMQRFEREATLAAQAKSPHVVQVFDHGVSQFGLPYIAMELLEGQDLAHYIASAGTVDPTLFANWLSQACRGLARAHGKGIVHRDIKPENIFLCDNDGEVLVKVLDFGIAKADGTARGFSGTQTGAFLGTAYYMSPEQTMGVRDLDHRSDLWAVGVVAFYALTGTRPFDGDAIGALVMAITMGAVPIPSSRNPRLAPSIDAWMAKALARQREERFQSAKEMAEAFQRAVGALRNTEAPVERASLPDDLPPLERAASGGVVARTNPTGLRASTMSPSVRPEEHDAVVLPKSRFPLLFAAGAGLVLLAAAAFGVSRLGAGPSPSDSSTAASPVTSEAALPVPTLAVLSAPAPRPSSTPAPEPPPPSPAAAVNSSLPKPGKVAAAVPAAGVPAARSKAGATTPPIVAAPAAAPPAAAQAQPTPSKPATAPVVKPNPLQMKME